MSADAEAARRRNVAEVREVAARSRFLEAKAASIRLEANSLSRELAWGRERIEAALSGAGPDDPRAAADARLRSALNAARAEFPADRAVGWGEALDWLEAFAAEPAAGGESDDG